MIEMNKKMSLELRNVQWEKVKLNRKLQNIIDLGFFTSEGCVFLSHYRNRLTVVSLDKFTNRTVYEAFVNSIHIDDYYKGKDQLGQGLKFFGEIFKKWNDEQPSTVLTGILSKEDERQDVTLKIHVQRSGERLLSEDLEGFAFEDILMIDSKEAIISL